MCADWKRDERDWEGTGVTMTKATQRVRSTGTGLKNKLKHRIARTLRARLGFYRPSQLFLGSHSYPAYGPRLKRGPVSSPISSCSWKDSSPSLLLAVSGLLKDTITIPGSAHWAQTPGGSAHWGGHGQSWGPAVASSLMPRISCLLLFHKKDIKTFLCGGASKTLS